jgi:hypothetical protein
MCFEIVAQNYSCCDTFDKSCLNLVYFNSDSDNYVGCYGCPSENANCCYLIQNEANRLNPEANSHCCENFDSYCVEAYETLKNTKGNFCSDNTSLKDYYVNTYSTDYRPCAFTDKKADECIAELDCSNFNSVECIDSLYSKLTDYSSACQCTCLKQANFLSDCMLHVIHKEPTCCHSWTAECENIRQELEISQGNICSISPPIGLGLDGGPGGPGTISCGCQVENVSWGAMPCDVYNFFCNSSTASDLEYNCSTQSVSSIIEDYMRNHTDNRCDNVSLDLIEWPICYGNGSSICFEDGDPYNDILCSSCYENQTGFSWDGDLDGNPDDIAWYDILLNCDACAATIAKDIFPDLDTSDCNAIDAAITTVRISAAIIKAGTGGSVVASDCNDCCALCRYLGQNAEQCGCQSSPAFVITETPDENNNDLLVYEGQGITFTTVNILSPYLYYELLPAPTGNPIDKNDIANSDIGANGVALGMTGIVNAIGTEAIVHIKFANDGTEGSEYFKFKAYELTKFENCPYGLASSATIEVKEPVTYTLFGVPTSCQINEGQTLSLIINTTNAPSGTIYYKIVSVVGASQNDFGIALEGSRPIVSSSMTLDIPITADSTTEPAEERFRVHFSRTSDFATTIATTDTECPNGIRIIDTSQTDLSVNVLLNGSSDDAVIEEGSIATFRVQSNRDGDFYYKINTNGTNFSASDLENSANPPADTELEDLFTISNFFANINKKIKADFTTESTESFKLEVRLNSTQGPLVATSPTAFIVDSSGTPSFTISGPTNTVEGQSYQYNIVTTNSPYLSLWYRIVPVFPSEITVDDFNIDLSGIFALSSGLYDLTLPVATDLELEGPEQFRIELWPSNDFSNDTNRLASTETITLQDSTQDITISPDTSILTEGQSVIFTVNTENISDSILTYEIIPTYGDIEASDFTSGSLTGSFNLTGTTTKTGSFTLTLVNNPSYEGEERFVVNIYDSSSSLLITSEEIKVRDAEPTYGIVPSTNLVTEGDSFTVTVNTTNYPNQNVYYRIEPLFGPTVDASDFEDGLEGAIPITSSSVVHTIQTLEKSIFSGTRGFRIVISDILNGFVEKASSSPISLQDASPTYEIEVPGFVLEGDSFDFTVNTTNLPNGTTLYYKINGTVNASDFSSGLTGSFVVTGNTKTVTIQTENNSAYEGPESFTIQIFDDVSLTPPAKVESDTIILLDGPPTYGPLNPNTGIIVEGGTQAFTFATTNVAPGTVLYYDIIPESGDLNANDFSPATLSGSFTVGSSFSITAASNIESEINETFKIQISSDSGPEYISNLFELRDGAAKYVISADKYSVQEGDDVTFTVNTENVADGTNLIYYLSGDVNAFDFEPEGITGPIVINGNYYQFVLGISADLSSEGTETFTAVVKQDDAGDNLSDPTELITISDTSTTYYTVTPVSGPIIEGQSETFTVTRTGAGTDGTFYYGITGIKDGQEIKETDFVGGLTGEFTLTSGVGTFTLTTIADTELSNRQFIVKIGTTNDPYNSVIAETNLFSIVDVNPEYTLTTSIQTITEGSEGVTFTIQATNVPAGTQINYNIEAVSGSITHSDFTDGQLSGTIVINSSGEATLYKEASNDCQYENGLEQFQIVFSKDGSDVAYSPIITILDPSPTFVDIEPFGCINGCGCEEGKVREGTSVTFTVTGCNIPNNFGQYRALVQRYPSTTGFENSDVTPFTQNLTFNNNRSTFTVFINNTGSNTLYEEGDSFVVKIRPVGAGNDLLSSGCFTIIDALPTGTVTPNFSSVSEGDTITFNIVVQNVPNNSSIQYEIIGLSEEDLVDGQLTGNVIVTASGNDYVGSVTKTISTDSVFGEDESLVFVIYYNAIELDRTDSIAITDTTPPPTPEDYTISVTPNVVTAGRTFTINVETVNVPRNTPLLYKFENVIGTILSEDDFNPPGLEGQVTISSNAASKKINVSSSLPKNKQFKVDLYKYVTGLLGDTQLVATSNEIIAIPQDDGGGEVPDCQFCQPDGCETIFICRSCDTACGRVSYFGTGDAFVGYRSEAARSQQPPGTSSCCNNTLGGCTPCPGEPDVYDCGCKIVDEQSSISYGRFSKKQFITVKENGVYKNREITIGELIDYKNKSLTVPIALHQAHEVQCLDRDSSCSTPTGVPIGGESINTACITGESVGLYPCNVTINSFGAAVPNTKDFFDVGPLWQGTFSNGLNSVRTSYGLPPINNSPGFQLSSVSLSGVVDIPATTKQDPVFNYLECQYQNYLFGNKNNVPDGLTAAFIADYINETFTPELCNLIDTCSLGTFSCVSAPLENCLKEMDSECFNRAERYGIIKGCTSAYGYTLGDVWYQSENKNDFVFFFQGINPGNLSTLTPPGQIPANPIGGPVAFGITYNDCFSYYATDIDPSSQCKRTNLFSDPMYWWGAFSLDAIYQPTQTATCDILLGTRSSYLNPPQSSGACYMIDTDGNNITAEDQFQTLSYFSKNSPYRGKILNNFIQPITAKIGSYGGSDFLSRCICTYFMPRHPFFSQEVGGLTPFYAYGYKHVPGYEGGFEINECPLYDLYKSENERKTANPDIQLIPGHPDAFYSLEGEMYWRPYGPVDTGGDGGSALLPTGCVRAEANEGAAFDNIGMQNSLTEWPPTQEAKSADPCEYTNNAYAIKIKGHNSDSLLPDNNATKYFNACFPCRGFIDLPANGFDTAVFTEYEIIGDGIKRMIVKSYTKEGNYTNHSVGSILARMTLKDQIAQDNIYYTDVAYFALNLIGSGIETLHTRETTKFEYYGSSSDGNSTNGQYLGWDKISGVIPPPSEYRARKLILTRGLHESYGLPLDAKLSADNFFIHEYRDRPGINWQGNGGNGLNTTFSMENGGYIGVKGQLVVPYTDGIDSPSGNLYSNTVSNTNNVHGIFKIDQTLNKYDLPSSDRNSKVNNSVGILRVHKDYDIATGLTVPSCREKFETLDGSLSNCNLPNNLVMSGLCWITTVFESDIWNANGGPRSWAFGLEQTEAIPPNPGDPVVDFTSFETWLETTRVPSNILDNNLSSFMASITVGINSAKTNNQLKYIGNGNKNVIPTPVTEELYLARRNSQQFVYDFEDFRRAAAKSKENDYACFDPNSSAVQYSCADEFGSCSSGGLLICDIFQDFATLQTLEAGFIATISPNGNTIDQCIPFVSEGKFISIPTGDCLSELVSRINTTYSTDLFGCTISAGQIISLIEKFILSRSNPCVFQYNNKIYRVMKEA